MSVFRNYNPHKAGDVNANAFPRVHPIPWEPTQRNIRSNPNVPSQPQRVQPHERGTFFGTSASAGGTLAPSMGSCTGCGGCSDCGSAVADVPSEPTAAQLATGHALPGSHIARPIAPYHYGQRAIGAIRSKLPKAVGRSNLRLSPMNLRGGR